METAFKKINPRSKLEASTHSCYDYKSTNYNHNNYQKSKHSREGYKFSLLGKQILFVIFVREKATKLFNVETEGKKIFVRI